MITVGGTIPADDIAELKRARRRRGVHAGRADAGDRRFHPRRVVVASALSARPIDSSVNAQRKIGVTDPRRSSRDEDMRLGQGGPGRRGRKAHRPLDGADGPQRREEPQPVRHARDRGGDADPRGRRGRGRGDRRRDDGPGERRARAAQGRLARRRPLGAPHRRRRSPAPTWRRPATRSPDARAREPRPGAARPAVRRRRVLHDRRGRRRAPAACRR